MEPLKSRMPGDRAYWRSLATKIAADAEPVLLENAEQATAWWSTLARACPALAAAASVALVVGSIVNAATPAALGDSPYVEVARVIGPQDQVAQLLLSRPEPPLVELLLPVMGREEVDQ